MHLTADSTVNVFMQLSTNSQDLPVPTPLVQHSGSLFTPSGKISAASKSRGKGEGKEYLTGHTADHLHDESNMRADVKTSNGLQHKITHRQAVSKEEASCVQGPSLGDITYRKPDAAREVAVKGHSRGEL
ncbi:hypothetical protein BTVI_13585 [Pitangus sulphuratus]|nr:hypothetical protein BTVI_13585 [Pitangus sulphuratus]